MYGSVASDLVLDYPVELMDFNSQLNAIASLARLNEDQLVQQLAYLDEISFYKDRIYWLSLARINELALICAANYAENCEFDLVGDLLINPRLVLVHVRGRSEPIRKERHTPLTEQFKQMAGTRKGVIQWLKTRACVENRIQALLPDLLQRLKDSGMFRKSYISFIEIREQKVADLSAYLACQGFESRRDLDRWILKSSPADRNLMTSKLCGFDFRAFEELGQEVENLAHHAYGNRNFIRNDMKLGRYLSI